MCFLFYKKIIFLSIFSIILYFRKFYYMIFISLIFLGVLKVCNLNLLFYFFFKGKRKGYNKWKLFFKGKINKML